MEETDQCFYVGCLNYPEYKCDCSRNQLMCQQHIHIHLLENQTLNHNMKTRFTYISSQWLNKLPQLKQKILQAKSLSIFHLLLKSNQNIQELQKKITQIFRNLQIDIKYLSQKYDKLLNMIQILLDSSRISQNLTPSNVQKIMNLEKHSVKMLSKKIEGKNKKHLYHLRGKNIYTINIKNQQCTKIEMPSFNSQIHRCSMAIDLNENTIIHLGCANESSYYIVNKKSGSFKKIPQIPNKISNRQGCVKFRKFIYVFGGLKNKTKRINECYFFDLQNLKWKRIANLPIESHCNSAVRVGEKIFVTGYQMKGIYDYDPTFNSFKQILHLQGVSYQTLFKTSYGEIIYLNGIHGNFKLCEKDLNKWIKIGEPIIKGWNMTNRCEHNGKVYYLGANDKLVAFDIKTYEIEEIPLVFN